MVHFSLHGMLFLEKKNKLKNINTKKIIIIIIGGGHFPFINMEKADYLILVLAKCPTKAFWPKR